MTRHWESRDDDGKTIRLESDDSGNYVFLVAKSGVDAAQVFVEADELWSLIAVIDRLLHAKVYGFSSGEAPF